MVRQYVSCCALTIIYIDFIPCRTVWKKLGNMPAEQARIKFVAEIVRINPNWEGRGRGPVRRGGSSGGRSPNRQYSSNDLTQIAGTREVATKVAFANENERQQWGHEHHQHSTRIQALYRGRRDRRASLQLWQQRQQEQQYMSQPQLPPQPPPQQIQVQQQHSFGYPAHTQVDQEELRDFWLLLLQGMPVNKYPYGGGRAKAPRVMWLSRAGSNML